MESVRFYFRWALAGCLPEPVCRIDLRSRWQELGHDSFESVKTSAQETTPKSQCRRVPSSEARHNSSSESIQCVHQRLLEGLDL